MVNNCQALKAVWILGFYITWFLIFLLGGNQLLNMT